MKNKEIRNLKKNFSNRRMEHPGLKGGKHKYKGYKKNKLNKLREVKNLLKQTLYLSKKLFKKKRNHKLIYKLIQF